MNIYLSVTVQGQHLKDSIIFIEVLKNINECVLKSETVKSNTRIKSVTIMSPVLLCVKQKIWHNCVLL